MVAREFTNIYSMNPKNIIKMGTNTTTAKVAVSTSENTNVVANTATSVSNDGQIIEAFVESAGANGVDFFDITLMNEEGDPVLFDGLKYTRDEHGMHKVAKRTDTFQVRTRDILRGLRNNAFIDEIADNLAKRPLNGVFVNNLMRGGRIKIHRILLEVGHPDNDNPTEPQYKTRILSFEQEVTPKRIVNLRQMIKDGTFCVNATATDIKRREQMQVQAQTRAYTQAQTQAQANLFPKSLGEQWFTGAF